MSDTCRRSSGRGLECSSAGSRDRAPGGGLVGGWGRSPRKFLKNIVDLVPLRAILAIERPTTYLCQTPAEGALAGVWGCSLSRVQGQSPGGG